MSIAIAPIAPSFLGRSPIAIGGWQRPYMIRWRLLGGSEWGNAYLHWFHRDDDDRALHDHPWWFLSIVLAGGYYEVTRGPDGTLCRRWRRRFSIAARPPRTLHRIELARSPSGEVLKTWTLVLRGPRVREWGFLCPHGWVHWRRFTAGPNGELVGAGCDAAAEPRP